MMAKREIRAAVDGAGFLLVSADGSGDWIVAQINVFRCENCKKCEPVQVHDLGPYDDPVINPPDGWGFYGPFCEKFSCPECRKKYEEKE